MSVDVRHQFKTVTINGVSSTLDDLIEQIIIIDDLVIVRTDNDRPLAIGDKSMDRNVVAFRVSGDQSWIIQTAPHGGDRPKPYVAIENVDGRLIVRNWIGVDYEVDLTRGTVTAKPGNGRPW